MFALLAAASVAAAPAPDGDLASRRIVTVESPLIRGRDCGLWDAQPVRREAPTARSQPLGDLPPANLELAVLRLDSDGCSVPVIVRRNVSGDGRFASPGR